MPQRNQLNFEHIKEYQLTNWVLYAAQKDLYFLMNLSGSYRIRQDEEILYQGTDLAYAVKIWNNTPLKK